MVHHEDYTHELEQDGRVETALIGLRYTGPKSSVSPRQPRKQGGWPGQRTFQGGPPRETNGSGKVVDREPGPVQIGLNPDWLDDSVDGGSLAGLEALPDFEVIYDTAVLAEALLDQNYLPPAVFGTPPDKTGGQRAMPNYDVRRAVFDHLGLDDIGSGPGSHDEYRKQLAEIADVDLTGEEDSPVDGQRAQTYMDEYTRADLKDAAEMLRDGADDITLNAGKAEFADWLAKQDPQQVRAALNDDLDDEPETDGDDSGDSNDESSSGSETGPESESESEAGEASEMSEAEAKDA